jgi:hypothetical protein|tara:strand:- start:1571 stop:1675 length:105 start_codon:yes stop_codon:yes gene_type:complete
MPGFSLLNPNSSSPMIFILFLAPAAAITAGFDYA